MEVGGRPGASSGRCTPRPAGHRSYPTTAWPRAWAVTGRGRARPATPPMSRRVRDPNIAVRDAPGRTTCRRTSTRPRQCEARWVPRRGMSGHRVRGVIAQGGAHIEQRGSGRAKKALGLKWRKADRRHRRNSTMLHGSTSGKTSGAPAVLAAKRVSVRSGLAQWQQIGFRCSSEGPDGSETDFGAVTSRQKATIARSEAEFRCKNNRINSRCELLRPQTLWERDKRHPQNVLTAPKPVSLPVHLGKLLRNPFHCQKGPKAILATRLAPPHKAGSRPGRSPTRKTRRTSFPHRRKHLPQSWGADKSRRPNSGDSGISPCSATLFGPSKRRGAARA